METATQHTFDYIFCGAGASAGLLLIEMHEAGLLKDKRVLILERASKTRRDKTFCFWSHENESIHHSLYDIISHSWSNVILPGKIECSLNPYRYNHISSLDLYKKIDALADQYQWQRTEGEVTEISGINDAFSVTTNDRSYFGKLIFDSRTPEYLPSAKGEVHLSQSFIGWHILPTESSIKTDSFRFMDFEIDQGEFTQFVYTLPNADGTLLVEITRFGKEAIGVAEAEALLKEYIQRNFGSYTKLDEEHGCIPMSNAKLNSFNIEGVIQLGARNYSIKPSTGYAFKKMHLHARCITQSLVNGAAPDNLNKSHSHATAGRFPFYDSLLLDILENQPSEGKRIFESLFRHTPVPVVMKFLDEKSSIPQEIVMFSRLPIAPFLKSLNRKFLNSAFVRPMALTMLSLMLVIVPWQFETTKLISNFLLIAGLFLVGIPHGAVDHLLGTKSLDYGKMPAFIFRYLLAGASMALIWFMIPTVALVIFILYSAWHFGQADGELWGLNRKTSLLWGISLLTLILCSHSIETNEILRAMGTNSNPLILSWWTMTPWTLWFLATKRLAGAITTCWLMLSCAIPLPYAFGLYFIGQHSLTGWTHLRTHLQMTHKTIWLHSLPFHAGAWLILALFYVVSLTIPANSSESWGIFFIFLACLSFPHVIAMQKVYK